MPPCPKCGADGYELRAGFAQLGCRNPACTVVLFDRSATEADLAQAIPMQLKRTADSLQADVPTSKVITWPPSAGLVVAQACPVCGAVSDPECSEEGHWWTT